ncbi:espin-like protein [Protopterus annectens]|uniref:espin-like protein n=1 Tax=Protopterus annectens TaxID=7888 RepID=UPI001CFC248D|nr:espin-like protein [Protopterus annectens]
MDGWRYSQVHNAILGPFGELLTEDDIIYLEKQIESVQIMKKCQEYENELDRLAEELRNILPAPIVNITVNTQLMHQNIARDGHPALPLWCNRISGIVRNMSLLLTNVSDTDRGASKKAEISKMPNSELITVFSDRSEMKSSRASRESVKKEIHQCGVSVRNLRDNFEKQFPQDMAANENRRLADIKQEHFENFKDGQSGANGEQQAYQTKTDDVEDASDSGVSSEGSTKEGSVSHTPVKETTSLRKERIVVLFLSHWKKSTYNMLKAKEEQKDQNNEGAGLATNKQTSVAGTDTQIKHSVDDNKLGHFFQQRAVISKLISNWRKIISHVPSRQIRRLHNQQITYSPEQFLPRVNGSPVDYNTLTLDLFMLGYFHILELDLPSEERKMRHLLCFEVFDHLGNYTWETVRSFHKAVIDEIAAGKRMWEDGFDDIKLRFFNGSEDTAKMGRSTKQSHAANDRALPKVIVQSATPDEDENLLKNGSCLSDFSNDEICKYIDRSFAFWKEKEAEMFDFE